MSDQPNETWTFTGKEVKRSEKALFFELKATGAQVWLPLSQIHIKKQLTEDGFTQVIVPRWLIDLHQRLQHEFDAT